ncbi:hypothetical protein KCU67_g99, partial [Aureobasidium melanogenum]
MISLAYSELSKIVEMGGQWMNIAVLVDTTRECLKTCVIKEKNHRCFHDLQDRDVDKHRRSLPPHIFQQVSLDAVLRIFYLFYFRRKKKGTTSKPFTRAWQQAYHGSICSTFPQYDPVINSKRSKECLLNKTSAAILGAR